MAKPTILTSLTLNNSTADLSFRQSDAYTGNEESSSVRVTTLTTSSGLIDVDTVLTPKYFAFAHQGTEGSVLVSTDNVTFDQEVAPGDTLLLRLRNLDKFETQTMVTVADVTDSLNAKYVTLDGNSGTWAIWIDVDDSGTAEPAHGMTNSAKIASIVTDDTAAAVALAIFTDLSLDVAFLDDFAVAYDATVDDDLITITDKFTGTRTNLADTGTTGFTVATTQEGAAGRSVYAKSSAGEIETLISIMPG